MDCYVNTAELTVMAGTVFGEARGEGPEGMVAVAKVILNRVRRKGWMGHNVEEVCLKQSRRGVHQFSCWNEADPNHDAIMDAGLSDEAFRYCWHACLQAIGDQGDDDVCHYYAPAVAAEPSWAVGVEPAYTIGGHVFYRGIA